MTLKFVEYLYFGALECGFAKFCRKIAGLLSLNATFCDQRTDTNRSCCGRACIEVPCVQCQSRAREIDRSQSAIRSDLSNHESGGFRPSNDCISLNDSAENCADDRPTWSATVIGAELSVYAHGHPPGSPQQEVTNGNSLGLIDH